jgi:predicted ATPase/DNA-binding transcriptional LysR family regulator
MQLEARLRAFAAVARCGSVSRAADELYVSQPAVSKQLAQLEQELGRDLVTRGREGAVLTPAGEILADFVLRAEALLANAARALAADAGAETGLLQIAASATPSTYLLPPLLALFGERHPGVQLKLQPATSLDALELVRAHGVELAVVGAVSVPPELEAEPLADDEIVLVGPPALGGRRLRPRDLDGLAWISLAGSATRVAVDEARRALGIDGAAGLELHSAEAVKRVVAGGAGIAALSRLALDAELASGTLAILDVPRWRLSRTIAVIRARGVPLTPPAQRFLEMLREMFAAAEPPPNSNLPAVGSALVGREREVAELLALVRDGERPLTLTGAGGSGKTRLGLEVASRLVDEFRDGVYLIDLAPLREPELVVGTIARVVGAPGASELEARLRGQRMLLLIDNFEHLLPAAPAVMEAVAGAHELGVVATSRVPLGVPGERRYRVDPLAPDDAVALFLERARDVNPRFGGAVAVRRICERLDRLPLALELAAARARGTTAAKLAARLESRMPVLAGRRDAPARQRTLTAAIAWSYDLLDESQRELLARLAVFAGGWSTEAAERVCAADSGDLVALVEANLVRGQGDRFSMLETVREFAYERLADSGDLAAVRRRHAEFMVAVAEQARPLARGPAERETLDRLTLDIDNLRAALALAVDTQDAALGLTLAEALEPLWIRGMRQREAVRWLEPLLALEGEVDLAVRAGALTVAGRSAIEAGEPERAAPWLRAGLDLAQEAGDDLRTAWALHGLGHLRAEDGDAVAARSLFEQSLELFLRLGEHAPAGGRLTFLAYYAARDGDLAGAQHLLERAAEQYRLAGDPVGVHGCVLGVGDLALERGDVREALGRYREALPSVLRDGSLFDLEYALGGIAGVAALAGHPKAAARLWGAAERLDDDAERKLDHDDRARFERALGDLDEAEVRAGRALSDEQAIELLEETADELAASAGAT